MGALLVLCSLLHLLVDGVCAFAMLSRFIPAETGSTAVLAYNFCAFALQMPIGVLLDRLPLKKRMGSGLCAFLGVCLTLSGAALSPILLGLGNALFHIGAGTAIIREDRARGKKGAELGVFVAPGAIGLYLGRLSAGSLGGAKAALPAAAVLLLVPELIMLARHGREEGPAEAPAEPCAALKKDLPAFVCCFLVVVLRSYTGMSVHFSAASGALFAAVSVLAVAGGKALGGILSARLGALTTALLSLPLAALCYALSGQSPAAAVAALLLFNMTMPLTLYEPVRRRPESAGFFFGLLTFGLFLGFLPVWLDLPVPMKPELLGVLSCLLSLALILPALMRRGDA